MRNEFPKSKKYKGFGNSFLMNEISIFNFGEGIVKSPKALKAKGAFFMYYPPIHHLFLFQPFKINYQPISKSKFGLKML